MILNPLRLDQLSSLILNLNLTIIYPLLLLSLEYIVKVIKLILILAIYLILIYFYNFRRSIRIATPIKKRG